MYIYKCVEVWLVQAPNMPCTCKECGWRACTEAVLVLEGFTAHSHLRLIGLECRLMWQALKVDGLKVGGGVGLDLGQNLETVKKH